MSVEHTSYALIYVAAADAVVLDASWQAERWSAAQQVPKPAPVNRDGVALIFLHCTHTHQLSLLCIDSPRSRGGNKHSAGLEDSR
jgi:hypothetical protein